MDLKKLRIEEHPTGLEGSVFDPIDWEEGKTICEGNEAVFLQKIEEFDVVLGKSLRDIYNNFSKEEFRPIRTQARSLSAALTYLPAYPLRKAVKELRTKCEKTPLIEENAVRDKISEITFDKIEKERRGFAEIICRLLEEAKQFRISLADKTDTEPEVFLLEALQSDISKKYPTHTAPCCSCNIF